MDQQNQRPRTEESSVAPTILSSSRLLRLPVEIRTLIWSETLTKRCVHILRDAHVWSRTESFTKIHEIDHSHQHQGQTHMRCINCPCQRPIGLVVVCWQVYYEVVQLQYERMLICFASSDLALTYLATKLSTHPTTSFSLSHLRNVQLYLGPAKFNTHQTNVQNYTFLKALAKDAHNLEVLSLSFAYFYRAPQQTLPLGRKTLGYLLRFKGLTQLNLHMEQVLPGPIGSSELGDTVLSRFWFRWRCTQAILRRHACRSSAFGNGVMIESLPLEATLRQSLIAQRMTVNALRDLVLKLEANQQLWHSLISSVAKV